MAFFDRVDEIEGGQHKFALMRSRGKYKFLFMPITSWDALTPTTYAAGLPLAALRGAPPALPGLLEALHAVASDTDESSCSLELTVLFTSAVSDQRAARFALDLMLGVNASSEGSAAGGKLCDVAAWLLGVGRAECAEATAHHLQLLPRQLWCGGARRCGGSRIGPPATWAPSIAAASSISSQPRLGEQQISSSWAEAPHMAHGRWSWPTADPRCRRVAALSLVDGEAAAAGASGSVPDGAGDGASDGAVKAYLREAATAWGLSHSTKRSGARGFARPGRQLQLRLGHDSLLLQESFATLLSIDHGSANASAQALAGASLLSGGYSPPSGTRAHVSLSLFGGAEEAASDVAASDLAAGDVAPDGAAPLVARLDRQLQGRGFHLALETRARFESMVRDDGAAASSGQQHALASSCSQWAAIERLPSGAFFDPYQLRPLARRGALGEASGALVMGVTPLETPEMQSPISVALVHGALKPRRAVGGAGGTAAGGTASSNGTDVSSSEGLASGSAGVGSGGWDGSSSVPLHLRYAAPTSEGATHRPVALPPPLMFACCSAAAGSATAGDEDDGGHGWCPPLARIGHEWRAACASLTQAATTASTASAGEGEREAGAECGTWRRVAVIGLEEDHTLRARVPVGQLTQGDVVLKVTVASICAATLGLLWVLWRTPTPM